MPEFGTIVTTIGEQLITRHLQEGTKLELTEFAVGDGGGGAYSPTADMTALRAERWRGPIYSVEISEDAPNVLVIDALVPADVGGFTIREAGVFDAQGNLIGIMNTPQVEKVASADGTLTEQYIQMYLAVSSTEIFELKVDPSILMARREDLDALRVEVGETLDTHNGSAQAHGDIRAALSEKLDSAAITTHNSDQNAHPAVWTALDGKANRVDVPTTAAMNSAIATHNTASSAHADIRAALAEKANLSHVEVHDLSNRLNSGYFLDDTVSSYYCKTQEGIVVLQLAIGRTGGFTSGNYTLFNLPNGYYPALLGLVAPAFGWTSTFRMVHARIQVTNTGQVIMRCEDACENVHANITFPSRQA